MFIRHGWLSNTIVKLHHVTCLLSLRLSSNHRNLIICFDVGCSIKSCTTYCKDTTRLIALTCIRQEESKQSGAKYPSSSSAIQILSNLCHKLLALSTSTDRSIHTTRRILEFGDDIVLKC